MSSGYGYGLAKAMAPYAARDMALWMKGSRRPTARAMRYSARKTMYKRKRMSRKKAKRARFSRRQFGFPARTVLNKNYLISLPDKGQAAPLQTGTLYEKEILDMAFGTAIDNRERNVVNVRGFKLHLRIKNWGRSDPVTYHWAIVVPRNQQGSGSGDNFFRAYGANRTQDFDAAAMDGMAFDFYPINTDEYVIIKHKRITLGPKDGAGNYNGNVGRASYKEKKYWIPIKRSFRFDKDLADAMETPVLIEWCTYWGQPTNSITNCIVRYGRLNVSFRDPKVG